ncbi:hypothetical protein HN014_21260 [Aquimarina sp. TRL1]|uniref:carboxypeptidase-like regulatory domain-containing protein n=1 Tax=Aquimarina sp. (strain TRL1) TaxID=2736252 RepID=UPI0015885FB1|nr:carboxypeptidase-like regulatory domain-containing protein [Aquimarina sp. TRL1]QKX07332.1 hypothetical protein HN014_21260 [Aquimarina sp. TRL1]
MKNNYLFKHSGLLIFYMIFCMGHAQEHFELTGKIQGKDSDITGVLVFNLNTNKHTITDKDGVFTIDVNVSDTIRLTAVQYDTKQIVITDNIIRQKTILIELHERTISLDEVVITPFSLFNSEKDTILFISPSSLGLPNNKIKAKTKNERLLFEADHGKFIEFGASPFGVGVAVNLNKILNRLSGRTKKLKHRLTLDKNTSIEKEIIAVFPKKTIAEAFGIPYINIDDFISFCIHQTDFHLLYNTKSVLDVFEYMKNKSREYKKANGIH